MNGENIRIDGGSTQVPSGNQKITASIVPTMIDDAAQANIETYPLHRIMEALNNLSADPIRQLMNTQIIPYIRVLGFLIYLLVDLILV